MLYPFCATMRLKAKSKRVIDRQSCLGLMPTSKVICTGPTQFMAHGNDLCQKLPSIIN